MTDMTMSKEDYAQLARLQQDVVSTRAAWKAALKRRNAFMHERYNSYRADVHELLAATGLRTRDMVHNIVRGPRTIDDPRRAVSNTPSLRRKAREDTR